MRQHLVAVTGMSPAVVTETLYGIQRDGKEWPQAVTILTTAQGAAKLEGALQEAISRLCAEYDKPEPELAVHVIPGSDGNPIDDARSIEDHEALGDYILRAVRDLTRQDDVAIHASIAGGRKTMTYYLGYAMSLFGRPQDQLSHVLVSEGYEGLAGFFYPTREPLLLETRNGEHLDASQAEVVLADIPFLRLRDNLPQTLLSDGTEVRFRELVRCISLGDDERWRRALRLTLPTDRTSLVVSEAEKNGTVRPVLEVPMKPKDYAFYRALLRPQITREELWERDRENFGDTDLAIEVCCQWGCLNGQRLDRDLPLTELIRQLEDLEGPLRPDTRTLEALSQGVTGKQFSAQISAINRQLEKYLPRSLKRWLEPRVIADNEGARYDFYGVDFPTQQSKKGRFGIALRDEAITLSE